MNLAYHSVVHVLWFFLSKKTNYNHLWLAFSFGISRAGPLLQGATAAGEGLDLGLVQALGPGEGLDLQTVVVRKVLSQSPPPSLARR